MQKKTIYHITPYFPPHTGGMERYVYNLSEKLNKEKYDVEVITSNIGLTEAVSLPGVNTHYLPSKEFFNTPIIPSLITELYKANPQNSIFHLHVAQAFIPEIVSFVSTLKKIPLISHIHLDVDSSSKVGDHLLPIYKKIFLKSALQNSQKIIVQSGDYKKLIQTKYQIANAKFSIIPNGIDISRESSYTKHERATKRILFVGRMVTQKKVDLFLETMHLLLRSNYRVEAQIIGAGPLLKPMLEYTSRLGIENNIIFLGDIEHKDIATYYRQADVLVQTSERESFSTVLLEAMNYSCPIIATNIKGTSSILKDSENSLLVKSKKEDIAAAVVKILYNEKLGNHLCRNASKLVKKYDWNILIKDIENIYDNYIC